MPVLVSLSRAVRLVSLAAIGSLVSLSILGVIVSMVSLANLICLGSLVSLGSRPILLILPRLARQVNIAIVSELRSLPRTTRGISMVSLAGRDRLARLRRLAMLPGEGGLPRMGSLEGIRRETRLTIMVRTTRLERLNSNTTRQNMPPIMIRLTNHPGNSGKED